MMHGMAKSVELSRVRDPLKIVGIVAVVLALVAVGVGVAAKTSRPADDYVSSYTPVIQTAPERIKITVPANPRLLIVGDSYSAGTGATDPAKSWANTVGQRLGWDYRVDAIGGTGWTWGGGEIGDGPDRFPERIQRDGADNSFEPNIVFIQGGQNDYRSGAAGISNAVRDSIDIARVEWPDAQVVIFGPAAPMPLGAELSGINSAVRRGAFMARAGMIDATGWLTRENSGQFAAPDGSHVNDAGHAFLAEKFLEEFAVIGGPPVAAT